MGSIHSATSIFIILKVMEKTAKDWTSRAFFYSVMVPEALWCHFSFK